MNEIENFKISVLIPVYKVEKYVGRCLRSLFANTIIADCEVIIVDDCSPDGSMKVVSDVLEEFPAFAKNVVLRSHDCNRGSAAARNTALLQAHGKYIICVDSDDWVEPDYLEKLYAAAEKDNADVVMCAICKETEKKSQVCAEKPKSENYVMELLVERLHGWLHEKLIRLSLLREHNIGWVEGLNMCEDFLIMTKVFFFAKKVVHVPEPLYHYNCLNENSLTALLSEEKISQIFRAHSEVKCFLESKGVLEKYAEELDYAELSNINWTLLFCKKQKLKYFKLLALKKFYKNKYASFPLKVYLFFGYCKIYPVIFLIIQLKRFALPKR